MVIEETIEIFAPLTVVWRVFSTLADWEAWNTVCRDCCLLEGREMAPGACFSFTLRPYFLPVKITPRITHCEAGRFVVWTGKRFGVHAEHRFDFQEMSDRVVVISTEKFGGPLFFFSRLLLIPQQLHRLSKKLLSEIKQAAEAFVLQEQESKKA
jgi:hypothetical protein